MENTRRQFLAVSAGVAGTVLSGCTGGSSGNSGTRDPNTGSSTQTRASTAAEAGDSSYSVTMEPMGEVVFDSVPEKWMAYFSTFGDMGIALGQLDGLEALVFTENWPLEFYDSLPGVDISFQNVRQLYSEGSIDKEVFYELGCDIHLMDPNFIARLDDTWKPADFEEITNNVGPVFGNMSRRRDEKWHDYRYYSLYETFEKVAQVFREQERYRALKAVHDEFISELQSKLPTEERPEIGLLSINSDFEDGSFYAYSIGAGNGKKQYQDLNVRDAFGDAIDGGYTEWDYESILEIDPDILVFTFGFSHASVEEFENRMQLLREDPVGKQLSAVANDRLYRGGTAYQGPILNLLQTEAAAKQFYPETFGAWDGLDTLSRESEQLFDHHRVADIVTGTS